MSGGAAEEPIRALNRFEEQLLASYRRLPPRFRQRTSDVRLDKVEARDRSEVVNVIAVAGDQVVDRIHGTS